jgi:hypothetical protein
MGRNTLRFHSVIPEAGNSLGCLQLCRSRVSILLGYPNSNPKHQLFFTQAELDEAATKLGLSRDFFATPRANR